jgi:hypothetical protein
MADLQRDQGAGSGWWERRWTEPEDYQDWILMAIDQCRYATTSPVHAKYPRVQRGIIKGAVWMATEGMPRKGKPKYKYTTRYRSNAALALGEHLWKDGRCLVRHEHVWPIRREIDEIMENPADAERVLRRAQGCVVTIDEHSGLSKFDKTHDGWDRYAAARVDVVDMSTEQPQPFIADGAIVNKQPTA